MANTTGFSHDTLAHLLQDRKLSVPDFQREYAWQQDNIDDFWEDITQALNDSRHYFLGTVVLAEIESDDSRQSIVDGQQRIVTTALLIYAISSKLLKIGKPKAQEKIFSDYIADYDLTEEAILPKLKLSTPDQAVYEKIIAGESPDSILQTLKNAKQESNLAKAYKQLFDKLDDNGSSSEVYDRLISLERFLAEKAQVLLAVASGLSEAYVIFETLNDRGAALTLVDLLKNFLLSTVADNKVNDALKMWIEISSKLDDSEKLVSFIKADYTSRWGQVKKKDLYKSLQKKLNRKPKRALDYLSDLQSAVVLYMALHSIDSNHWSSISTDVRDSIIANRRFGIEATNPMYLAAMRLWKPKDYCELINISTSWSIRASLSGLLGGGTADRVYGEAAELIGDKTLSNPAEVRSWFIQRGFIPSDVNFRSSLLTVNDKNLSRVKYLLAKIEMELWKENGKDLSAFPAWDSKSISVEHIIANSVNISVKDDDTNSSIDAYRHALPNLTLLERTVNNTMKTEEFAGKSAEYSNSGFLMTQSIANYSVFSDQEVEQRKEMLLSAATKAWPI